MDTTLAQKGTPLRSTVGQRGEAAQRELINLTATYAYSLFFRYRVQQIIYYFIILRSHVTSTCPHVPLPSAIRSLLPVIAFLAPLILHHQRLPAILFSCSFHSQRGSHFQFLSLSYPNRPTLIHLKRYRGSVHPICAG